MHARLAFEVHCRKKMHTILWVQIPSVEKKKLSSTHIIFNNMVCFSNQTEPCPIPSDDVSRGLCFPRTTFLPNRNLKELKIHASMDGAIAPASTSSSSSYSRRPRRSCHLPIARPRLLQEFRHRPHHRPEERPSWTAIAKWHPIGEFRHRISFGVFSAVVKLAI